MSKGKFQSAIGHQKGLNQTKAPTDSIVDHPDPCPCPRCTGLEKCHVCERHKLDVDWCFACRRFVC